jgi:hypothetical protein
MSKSKMCDPWLTWISAHAPTLPLAMASARSLGVGLTSGRHLVVTRQNA